MKIITLGAVIISLSLSAFTIVPASAKDATSSRDVFGSAPVSYVLVLGFTDLDGVRTTVELEVDKATFDATSVGQLFIAGIPMVVVNKVQRRSVTR